MAKTKNILLNNEYPSLTCNLSGFDLMKDYIEYASSSLKLHQHHEIKKKNLA